MPPPQTVNFSRDIKHNLVVDGNSFMHFCARHVNWAYGSPYMCFAAVIERETVGLLNFFNAIFLFDGPLPLWKADQRLQRDKSKIETSKILLQDACLGKCPQVETSVLPPLALSVTLSSLRSCGAIIEIAHGEADLGIADKARELSALILSTDSDFFIHKGTKGFIPFDTLSYVGDNLQGIVWERSTVASALQLNDSLLPIMAGLAGCDYYPLPASIQISLNSKVLTSHGKQSASKRIRGFANYLRQFRDPMEALEDILTKIGGNTEVNEEVKAAFNNVLVLYDGGDHMFDVCVIPQGVMRDHLAQSRSIDEGRYSHKLVEAVNGVFWCQSFVEDVTRCRYHYC
jgi:hypothetical protein